MTEERKHYFQVVHPDESNALLFELVGKLNDRMDGVTTQLTNAVTEMRQQREGIERLLDGFPNGDPISHRKEHEASLRRLEAKAEFWQKLKLELAKWGLIGFVGWAAIELWNSFIRGPHA